MTSLTTPFTKLTNATGKHKDWYSPEYIQIFCKVINPQNKYFETKKFINHFTDAHSTLELKERLNLIVSLLDEYVEGSYSQKLKLLTPLLGERWPHEEGMFTHGFYLYPLSQFVEQHGAQDIESSLRFIEELTMRFTGEWAIRTIANADPERTLTQMKAWAKHENFHVRRLASEGLRARLPWGKKIAWIDKNPEKSLPIYNKLRNDKVLFVRRSVANSMGDMIKINEDLACNTFEKWLSTKKTRENLWVIKHAIRTPVKKNNKKFMALHQDLQTWMSRL